MIPQPTSNPTPAHTELETAYNTRYVWTISLVAALGGLLFGYDWVVIAGAKPFFERFFGLVTDNQKGWANSCALVGCLLGALVSGALSDRFGRKRLLILSAAIFVVSSIGTGLAGSFLSFVAWRIAGGVAIGLASNLSPMYIAEVAPAHMRGKLVSINQLTIVIGILLAQIVNWLVAERTPDTATAEEILKSWNVQAGWRWMFAVTAIPSAFFLLGSLFVPESPRWLVKNGRSDKARRTLSKIGGVSYSVKALGEIEATLVNETGKVDFRELLDPRLRKILWLGIFLAVFQQLCGINVIFNYAEEIFRDAGYPNVKDILLNIVITGTVNLVFTFVAIAAVDRAGRRVLMLAGAAGLTAIYLLLGACFMAKSQGVHMVTLVVSAIGCYGFSLAPVTWVLISEIFPNRIRGAAMSVAVAALWIACFILTFTFPSLYSKLGAAGTFWGYAGVCAAGFVILKLFLPETKGKTLEQIEKELRA